MNDLLGAVKVGEGNGGKPPGGGRGSTYDIEMGETKPPQTEQEKDMARFFEQVENVKTNMTDIRARQRELAQLHERSKTITRQKEMQSLRDEMQDVIDGANKTSLQVKNQLDTIDKLNEQALKKGKGTGPGSASERTRTSVTAGLKKKLKDLMTDFAELRQRIQKDYREVVERRVFTVTGKHLDEEEVNNIIESGEAEGIFKKAILDQGRGRVLDTLAEIQERHRAAKDLEASMLELHQIFLDMAVLVEAQGEMLDNIERQVAKAVDHVQAGNEALQQAKTLQKSKRKWMCCAIIFLLIVAGVIVLVVLKPWSKN